jgi:hypothetical protein
MAQRHREKDGVRLKFLAEILGFEALGLQEIGAEQEFRLRDLMDEGGWDETEVEKQRLPGKQFKALIEQDLWVEIVRTDSANFHHHRAV